ncbi:PEP-CTERM sorting domain-containing protein [Desulfopila aestuarii]|uniref:PEP-CTERM protein-sorting domain-containing protein n=1 Tax=Desulfopila aestuarii DSM 18488 TaxID=1121416 RepID=A0A1M7Y0R5_9BACT|nr:PEP-CTERM sorting domain-containing protein [Desulfopila aestuarii]SHO45280.1 PEP-CTERM protein-sorting domain-containing protein [Desulfopila aestuarii DSM 18488]
MSFRKCSSLSALLILGLTICGTASANLITNGSFESPEIGEDESENAHIIYSGGNSWTVFSYINGWSSIALESNGGIEIQENGTVSGVFAQDGDQYVELDSHPAPGDARMQQKVNLDIGTYVLDFYYRSRTSNHYGTNGISWGYEDITTSTSFDLGSVNYKSDWTLFSSTFSIASAGDYNIWFESSFDSNTVGGFIDNVSLTPIPEPATLLLFGAGISGIATFFRRKK